MKRRANALSEIRRLLKEAPQLHEILQKLHKLEDQCFKGMTAEAQRSAVLIATGFLEHGLAVAIGSFLVEDEPIKRKLFDGDHEREGIIGSVYARNVVARALDIYGEQTYSDVNSVRVIRNLCAHSTSELDFSSEKLRPLNAFQSITTFHVAQGFGTKEMPLLNRMRTQSPAHGLLQFVKLIVPYLMLHGSRTYVDSKNRADWRAMFS